MAVYCNSTLFLLSPAPGEGMSYEEIAKLYPQGRQTLKGANARLDSGIDLPTPKSVKIPAGEVVLVDLMIKAVNLHLHGPVQAGSPGTVVDIHPEALPWAYRLVPRSSISKTPLMMANSEGIIDLGYRGSLKAAVRNMGAKDYTIAAGTALFQIVDPFLSPPEYEVLPEEDQRTKAYFGEGATARGASGFGSTGAAGSAVDASASAAGQAPIASAVGQARYTSPRGARQGL